MGRNRRYYTQAAFAEFLGRTPGAISIAIKEGRVSKSSKGIDAQEELNRQYIHRIKTDQGTLRKEAIDELENSYVPPTSKAPSIIKVELSNKINMVKLERERLKYLAECKEFVPRSVVAGAVSAISSALDSQFSNFDERHGEQLHAIARADESPEAFCETLAGELQRSLQSVVRSIEKALKSMKREEEDADDSEIQKTGTDGESIF